MKQKYNNEPNTCGKHLKNLKQYLRFAVNMEWLTKSPFAEFKVSYKVKEKPYLNIDELKLLERKVEGSTKELNEANETIAKLKEVIVSKLIFHFRYLYENFNFKAFQWS